MKHMIQGCALGVSNDISSKKGFQDKKSVNRKAVDETSFRPKVLLTKHASTKCSSMKRPSTAEAV